MARRDTGNSTYTRELRDQEADPKDADAAVKDLRERQGSR